MTMKLLCPMARVAAIGWWLAFSPEAAAQADYPSTDEKCVNDHAGIIGKKDRGAIKTVCRKADKEGIEMMVVTIKSLDDFRPRPLSMDRLAGDLFDDWDAGYEEKGDALFLLVSVKEREFRILMGDRYQDHLRSKASQIIRNTVVAHFRRRRPSQGISRGFDQLFRQVVEPHIRVLKKSRKPRTEVP